MTDFIIETDNGVIQAEKWADPDCPGITVYVNGDQVVVAECDELDHPGRFLVKMWSNPDIDAVFEVIYDNLEEREAIEAMIEIDTSAGTISATEIENGVGVFLDGNLSIEIVSENGGIRSTAYYPGTDRIEFEILI